MVPTHHLANRRLRPWSPLSRVILGSPFFSVASLLLFAQGAKALRVWPWGALLQLQELGRGWGSLTVDSTPWACLSGQDMHTWPLSPCTCLPNPTCPRKPQQYLEVLINQEVTANEVEVAQLAVELGLDSLEAVGHDLLHPLLWVGQGGGDWMSPPDYTSQA